MGISADCDLSTSEQTDETLNTPRVRDGFFAEIRRPGRGRRRLVVCRARLQFTIRPLVTGPGSTVSRRTENTSFETSRTVRQVKMPRGSIKRISAALLLDQDVEWQGKGAARKQVAIPPAPERIKAIHDVVAVLGVTPERGDQLVIESLPFEQTRALEDTGGGGSAKPPAGSTPSIMKLLQDRRVLIGGGAALLLVVVLAFVLRRRKGKQTIEDAPAAIAAGRGGKGEALQGRGGGAGTGRAGGGSGPGEIVSPADHGQSAGASRADPRNGGERSGLRRQRCRWDGGRLACAVGLPIRRISRSRLPGAVLRRASLARRRAPP